MQPNLTLLRRGIELLRQSDPDEFDIRAWRTCAVGIFARDQVFIDAGLRMWKGMPCYGRGPVIEHIGCYAAGAVFGLPGETMADVFTTRAYGPSSYDSDYVPVTLAQVIDRMQLLIDTLTDDAPLPPRLEPEVARAAEMEAV